MTDRERVRLLESEYGMVKSELEYIEEKVDKLRTRQYDIAYILDGLYTKLALGT